MTSTWYLEKVVLPDGTWLLSVPSDPNGLVSAPLGSIASASDGSGPWKSTGPLTWLDLASGGGGGSLQQAYNFLPSGVINTSLAGGPISFTNPLGAAQSALVVTQNAPGQLAADITGSVRATSTVTALSLLIEDPLAGTGIYFDSADGQTAAVSALGHGRLRYNNALTRWEQSSNGAAYVPFGSNAYTPAVPSDWAPPPTTYDGALNEIVANGAGHFQKARNPLLAAPAIYFDVAGNDSTGDGSFANPFETIARAVTATLTMPEYNGGFASISAKSAGTYYVPQTINFGILDVFGTTPTVSVTYTVDAAQPANTQGTGSRIVLNTLALASTVPPRTRVNVTVGGTPYRCVVYRSDNSGPGGKLVLWVVATNGSTNNKTVITPAVGASVDVLTMGTLFACDDYTTIRGGYIHDVRFVGNAGGTFFVVDGVELDYCNSDIVVYVQGAGAYFTQPAFGDTVSAEDSPMTATAGGVWVNTTDGGCLRLRGGITDLQDEHAFVDASGGTCIAVRDSGGEIHGGVNSIWRMVEGIDLPFAANMTAYGSRGVGGIYALGDLLQPQTIAGAQIGGVTGTELVSADTGTRVFVKLGGSSNITLGGTLNPVKIGGVAISEDISGTRIEGGRPYPSPSGPALRVYNAGASTAFDPSTDATVVLDTAALTRDCTLPAASSVTKGFIARVKKGSTANDATVTPNPGDTIDGVAGVMSYNAIFGPGTTPSVDFESDGSSGWYRV